MLGTTLTDAPEGATRLEVCDLDRSIAFYRDLLGLRLRSRRPSGAALEALGGPERIDLDLRDGPAHGAPGHAAFVVPNRRALARTLRRVLEAGVPITGTADHGVGEAVYLRDPDGNGVELHRDRPEHEWPRLPAPALNRPLDLRALLARP